MFSRASWNNAAQMISVWRYPEKPVLPSIMIFPTITKAAGITGTGYSYLNEGAYGVFGEAK